MEKLLTEFYKKYFTHETKTNAQAGIFGRYRFAIVDSITGEMIERSPWIHNKVVKNGSNGVNNVAKHLNGEDTNPLEISKASIGTGTTAPADGDIALESETLGNINLGGKTRSLNVVDISIFITDAELPNGTYTELGLHYVNNDLFARSLIQPAIVKGSNQNISIDYQVTVNN